MILRHVKDLELHDQVIIKDRIYHVAEITNFEANSTQRQTISAIAWVSLLLFDAETNTNAIALQLKPDDALELVAIRSQ